MSNQDIFNQFKKLQDADEPLAQQEKIWEEVAQRLDKKEKKRILFPWKTMGVAASVILLVATGVYFLMNTQQTQPEVVDKPTQPIEEQSSIEKEESIENTLENTALSEVEVPKEKMITSEKMGVEPPPPIPPPVIMEIDHDGLEIAEVVLISYSTQLQEKMTGAVSVVSEEYIETRPRSTVINKLQGKVAGISIQSSNGAPGSNPSVVLRGAKSIKNAKDPLIIVDGVPLSHESYRNLNPNNIKDVSVLKDNAATSIYGNRGANGVIIITTKNGLDLSNKTKRQKRKIERKRRRLQKRMERLNPNDFQEQLAQLDTIAPVLIQHEIRPNRISISNEEYSSFVENTFKSPQAEPLSTFSIDVDRASYSNVRRFLNNGQTVPKDAVRVEEMINYFDYQYPEPTSKHPFGIYTEYGQNPWNNGHQILKIGLKGKEIPRELVPASNLVFLLDVSGSMNSDNKLPLLKKSFELLVKNLRKEDRISIVVYAGAAGVVLPSTSGNEKTTILEALNNLSAGGSTAGAQGIELAYQIAQENFIKNGNNRVILATDGDFNVGISDVNSLQELIEEKRKTGIFLTCLGFGMGNYKDNRLETLSDKGNGNYAYIDNLQEANKFLVKEFSGTLYTIAKDVKIQIEFNPQWVQAYRLIGYENRLLRPEDFRNDSIDAGEIGAGHTVTAIYEIIPTHVKSPYFSNESTELKYQTPAPKSGHSEELATIKFRYKKPDEDTGIEFQEVVKNDILTDNQLSTDYYFATGVAWFGLKLRDSEYISNKNTTDILEWSKKGLGADEEGYRHEFIRLVDLVE